MHQLARMGTRIWSSRGRQTARREAFGACADNREQRLWVKEGRGWCVPTLTKCPFEPVDQERKKPEARSRRRSRPGSSSGPPKSQGSASCARCESKRRVSLESCGFHLGMLCHGMLQMGSGHCPASFQGSVARHGHGNASHAVLATAVPLGGWEARTGWLPGMQGRKATSAAGRL